jgi:hypothetical protein
MWISRLYCKINPCYPLLDTSPGGRIIKDVMRRQTGEGKKVTKQPESTVETGFEGWKLWRKAVKEPEVDAADFFDPEEFGYRRRGSNAPRP